MSVNDSAVNQSRCIDCGGKPRFRGDVTWEDENEVEHTTTCTSSFHVIVKREKGAYEYWNEKFESIHTTSVPMTDQEAIEYFSTVDTMLLNESPKYILSRPLDGDKFEMMPYTYDTETGEVNEIVQTS